MKTSAQKIFWSLAIILISIMTLMAPAPVQADTTSWIGTTGDWSESGNWDNGVPTSTLDAYINNGGTANIVDGDAAAAQNIHFGVSAGAVGTITQSGGSLTVSDTNPGLMLGSQPGGAGYYNLEGGSLDTQTEAIGNGGYGEFLQKAGTTHTVAVGMTLGQMTGGEGKYTLEGGSLSLGSTGFLNVGGPGTGTFIMQNGTLETAQEGIGTGVMGTFTQTGGTHTVSGGLNVGAVSGSQGYFNLEGGNLNTQGVAINHGEFVQKAGSTHTVGQWLMVGGPAGADGQYTLEGGSLSLASGAGFGVGNNGGTGTFTQTSGSVSWTAADTGGMTLGSAGGTGTYYLKNDATLSLGGNVMVGGWDGTTAGTGFFYQSGGTLTNTRTDALGRVLVGYVDGSQGTYELSGGSLTVDRMIVGYSVPPPPSPEQTGTGQGTLTISGGQLTAGTMIVGGGDSGTGFGRLELANASAQVVVSTLLQFGGLGQLSAVPGATIHMTGSAFKNTSQDPASLAGLSNLTLTYDGTGTSDPFEVAGTDLGAVMAGFTDNFALGTLKLGAGNTLQLVDESDNNGISDFEALYVYNLELDAGAILDLNNLHLYYLNLTDLGGSFLNGSPQAAPLPGAVWLLGSGLLGLAGLRRKLRR